MQPCNRVHFAIAGACVLLAEACTSYGPQLEPLRQSDRFRVVADSPFTVTTAGRDRVPTGSCRATGVTGRVLDVRGDTLVVGGSPIIVPAPGAGCDVAITAIFVAPAHPRDLEVRRADAAKTVWTLSGAAFAVYLIGMVLAEAFPET